MHTALCQTAALIRGAQKQKDVSEPRKPTTGGKAKVHPENNLAELREEAESWRDESDRLSRQVTDLRIQLQAHQSGIKCRDDRPPIFEMAVANLPTFTTSRTNPTIRR